MVGCAAQVATEWVVCDAGVGHGVGVTVADTGLGALQRLRISIGRMRNAGAGHLSETIGLYRSMLLTLEVELAKHVERSRFIPFWNRDVC